MWKVMELSFDDKPDKMVNVFGTEEEAETYIEKWRDWHFNDTNVIVLYTEQI